MMDDIVAIQQRIADIQSRIASLTGGNVPQPSDSDGASSTAAAADPQGSFESVLAGERARYGAYGASGAEGPGSIPSIPMGRQPYVPAASMGPLPSSGAEPQSPFVPTTQQIEPIQSGDNISQYEPIIDRYAAANGVSPNLVKAVIKTESDGNPRDVSRAGAMGLMQLMPDNVKDAGIDDPFDPEQNIAAGTKQLSDLLTQYGGNLDLALAGYNAGPGNVRKYGGVPPFPETENYIKKVRAAMGQGQE